MDAFLLDYQADQVNRAPKEFHRYMYNQLPWGSRMVGLVGPRGVGKSTLLLQHFAENKDKEYGLYVSADTMYFASHLLIDIADEFVKDGGQHLYIDEVHKYKNWSRELKQIYDTHPDLKVTFTGSSILDILEGEADLSRRAIVFTMQGLSFREYLAIFHHIQVPVYGLQDILTKGTTIRIPGIEHPLPLFRHYLQVGYYPFAQEDNIPIRIEQIVKRTIESDIAQYADLKASTARKLVQLVSVISRLAPMKPNADSLSQEIGVSKNNINDYLTYLERAGLIGLLRDSTSGLRGLGKIEKIYLDNPSLMTILANGHPEVGNLRETFFYNQTRVTEKVVASKVSDFEIGEYTFEIGGKKKGKKQIEDITNSYIVKDDIENAGMRYIPLWMFGLMY